MANIEYLAGYFDGEGCVTVNTPSGGRCSTLKIQIQSGDREVLQLFAVRFGGKVNAVKQYTDRQKRALFSWVRSGRDAQEALKELLPFLVSKHEVAELALQIRFYQKSELDKHFLPEEEVLKRLRIKEQISAINQRVTIN